MQKLYERLLSSYDAHLNYSGVRGERVAARLDELSKIGSTESGGITRVGYSNEEREAKELIISWMKEAGLAVETDGAGNVFGRLEGKRQGASIMSGSHVDSVPNGGHFDGPLGVLAALEVVESWKEQGYTPEKPYTVAIFSDEEGSRFKSGLTGSRAFMGKITPDELDSLRDEEGKTFSEVIEAYGSTVEDFFKAGKKEKQIEMFVEVHIEQGKQLEKADQPVGIVSGIAGPAWVEITFTGEAGHAGNTPMTDRKDPLVAAGIFLQSIEELPKQVSNTAVATVGKLHVQPNGVNVIPKQVEMIVDIRDIQEETRDQLLNLITGMAKDIGDKRQVDVDAKITTKISPLPIHQALQGKLAKALETVGISPIYIPSGAGHDAMIVGQEFPVAMLFVRSKDGISHTPSEWTSLNDCVFAVHVLKSFIQDFMEA